MEVAVLGSGNCKAGEILYDSAETLGGLLVKLGHVVLTGGYGGVMEAAPKGAVEAGGKAIGITLEAKPKGNKYLTETIVAKGENIQKQFTSRLGKLMSADAFILFLRNSSGTYVELNTLLQLARFCELGPIILWDPVNCWRFLQEELGRKGFTQKQLGTIQRLVQIEKIADLLKK